MADSQYSQSSQNVGTGWQAIKLRDIGDGTYAVANFSLPIWDKAHISSVATTLVKDGMGVLGGIVINKATTNGTVTVVDGVNAQGSVIGVVTHGASPLSGNTIPIGCRMEHGITVVTSGADDLTVLYL